MANAQKPTKRTKHMDTQFFALQDWVNRDLIVLKCITASDNYADAMTKALSKSLFWILLKATSYQHTHLPIVNGQMMLDEATLKLHIKLKCYISIILLNSCVRNLHHGQGRKLGRILCTNPLQGHHPFYYEFIIYTT